MLVKRRKSISANRILEKRHYITFLFLSSLNTVHISLNITNFKYISEHYTIIRSYSS
jgi:hypothetical protein